MKLDIHAPQNRNLECENVYKRRKETIFEWYPNHHYLPLFIELYPCLILQPPGYSNLHACAPLLWLIGAFFLYSSFYIDSHNLEWLNFPKQYANENCLTRLCLVLCCYSLKVSYALCVFALQLTIHTPPPLP